ncbi:MAG: 50S ribosomal protein L21 [Thermodesulfobacteriota bacterium]
MYAIVRTGGKQYRVAPGDQLKVERISAERGEEIVLDQVLAIGDSDGIHLGTPTLEGAQVKASVLRQARDRKVIVFKKKRRKAFDKKQGHRQWYTLLRIQSIGQETE